MQCYPARVVPGPSWEPELLAVCIGAQWPRSRGHQEQSRQSCRAGVKTWLPGMT